MLHEFLSQHRDEVIARAKAKVAARRVPVASPAEIEAGVPLFLSQLSALLREEQLASASSPAPTSDARAHDTFGHVADQHGGDMLRAGLTVAQVVEGYGDVCQAITELAVEMKASIGPDEYRTLNLCLDVATSRAVTAFSGARDRHAEQRETERLGALAHELRNLLSTAVLSYEALRKGTVGMEGSTGALLGRSLRGLRDLIDRSLAEVRLAATPRHVERVSLAEFIEEMEVGAALDARARGLELSVAPVDYALSVNIDRQLLSSAVANLVQNAVKFSRPGGRVTISTRHDEGRTFIDVEDECGGLVDGRAEKLFEAFHRAGPDRSGLGLGLKISRDAVAANGGDITVRNLPGRGCVFTVGLPAPA